MSDNTGRILDEDELITLDAALQILGNISVSTAYEDPELMRLKIKMTSGRRKTKAIRFIRREIFALRAERVARADADAENVAAKIEARNERRRLKQRERKAAKLAAIKPQPKPAITKPGKLKLRPRAKAAAEIEA